MRFDELYEAERGRLERRLARMLGSRVAAEDVAQEAVVRTLQRAPAGLRPHEQKAWLHRTATNLAIYAAGVATQPHVGEPHSVSTLGTSLMRRVVGRRLDDVTSQHHQAPSRLGRGLRVSAAADDGVIEAVELPRRRLTFGVQWHPESEEDSEAGRQLAGALIEAASR